MQTRSKESKVKILLAIDDSKFSEGPIEAVIRQTTPQETEVRVLHVIEPIPIYPDGRLGDMARMPRKFWRNNVRKPRNWWRGRVKHCRKQTSK